MDVLTGGKSAVVSNIGIADIPSKDMDTIMGNIKFSIASRSESFTTYTQMALAEYADVTPIGWGELWNALRKTALVRKGYDLSEIGSTWLGSFVGMTALRPFTPRDVTRLGGADMFFPAAWQSASLAGDNRVWSIPWMADTRVIFYWRDLLEKAGIDEATAFSSAQHMEETFRRLKAHGIATPWGAPSSRTNVTVHHITSWVWGAGGEFVNPAGTQTAFTQPEGIRGISDYFRLHAYMPKGAPILEQAVDDLFYARKVACMMNGLWCLGDVQHGLYPNVDLSRIGVALPPGAPFVGGSNLVLWEHITVRDEKAAIDLVTLLLGADAQAALCYHAGQMPVRMEVLKQPPYSDDPYYKVFGEAMRKGRALPNVSLWGVVEDKLIDTFGHIWEDILAQPTQRVEDIVAQHLEPLAARLDKTLAQA
jgi:multiple sugar transport system substrate-binding protein